MSRVGHHGFRSACGFFSLVHGKRRRPSDTPGEPAASRGLGPPDWRPSGAGLGRGPRVSCRRFTPARMAPHRGCAASHVRRQPAALCVHAPARLWLEGVRGTCGAMAHRHPMRARAIATTTWLACFPGAITRRSRGHRRTWAVHLRSWMAWGCGARRRGTGRLTCAGDRDAQAPSSSTRRA
jgi:hypothetical protein